MLTRLRVFAAVGGLLFLGGCGGSGRAKDVPFSGTWKMVEENGINKAKSEATVEVTADKGRFRIVTTAEEHGPFASVRKEETVVFDGEQLYRKSRSQRLAADGSPAPEGDAAAPETLAPAAAIKPEPAALRLLRFWVHDEWLSGLPEKEAHDTVAGREIVYREGKKTRPDGEISLRVWADRETGVILRAVSMIYSTQVDSMVTRTTQECQQIRFGPVDEAAFAKP